MCKQWAGIEPALQDGAWVDWQVNFAQIFASLEGFETMKELHLDWACLIILSRMTWRIDFVCVCVCEREREQMFLWRGRIWKWMRTCASMKYKVSRHFNQTLIRFLIVVVAHASFMITPSSAWWVVSLRTNGMDAIWCKQALDQVICKDTTHNYVHFEIPIWIKKAIMRMAVKLNKMLWFLTEDDIEGNLLGRGGVGIKYSFEIWVHVNCEIWWNVFILKQSNNNITVHKVL